MQLHTATTWSEVQYPDPQQNPGPRSARLDDSILPRKWMFVNHYDDQKVPQHHP